MADEKKGVDLAVNEKVKNVSGLMISIEEEISQIKSGEIKEGVGRLVFKGRSLQMKAVEIALQAARLESSLRRDLAKRIDLTIFRKALRQPIVECDASERSGIA